MRTGKTNWLCAVGMAPLLCFIVSTAYAQEQQQLEVKILEVGAGKGTHTGDEIFIHEQTRYRDGTLIFSSYEMDPLKVTLGAKQMIEGLDQGLVGMKVGELRQLVVPPSLSQRKVYPDSIHPDSILIYEVRLIEIVNKE